MSPRLPLVYRDVGAFPQRYESKGVLLSKLIKIPVKGMIHLMSIPFMPYNKKAQHRLLAGYGLGYLEGFAYAVSDRDSWK